MNEVEGRILSNQATIMNTLRVSLMIQAEGVEKKLKDEINRFCDCLEVEAKDTNELRFRNWRR